jgi:hypothetical protein
MQLEYIYIYIYRQSSKYKTSGRQSDSKKKKLIISNHQSSIN